MSHPFHRVLAATSALLFFSSVTQPAHSAETADVVAQRLNAPAASTKVAAVLWTRRADRYTLQVVFPKEHRMPVPIDGRRPGTGEQDPAPQAPAAQNPSVMLWLLGADGTVFPASIARPLGAQQGVRTNEVAYSVSLNIGERVVAAALKVDDEYFIEPLRSLSER